MQLQRGVCGRPYPGAPVYASTRPTLVRSVDRLSSHLGGTRFDSEDVPEFSHVAVAADSNRALVRLLGGAVICGVCLLGRPPPAMAATAEVSTPKFMHKDYEQSQGVGALLMAVKNEPQAAIATCLLALIFITFVKRASKIMKDIEGDEETRPTKVDDDALLDSFFNGVTAFLASFASAKPAESKPTATSQAAAEARAALSKMSVNVNVSSNGTSRPIQFSGDSLMAAAASVARASEAKGTATIAKGAAAEAQVAAAASSKQSLRYIEEAEKALPDVPADLK